MAAPQFEILKCENCGKTLGYIYLSARTNYLGMLTGRYWPMPGRAAAEIEKVAFCEDCFQQKLKKTAQSIAEPKSEEHKPVESRSKSKDRPLIR